MKLHISVIALFLVSILSFGQEVQDGSHKISTAVMEIEGMACQEGCADKISSNLRETDGVTSAEVSYEKKEAIIKFDPSILSLADLKAVITNTKVKEYIYTVGKTTIKD